MKPEIKEKFISALESGKFKRTHYKLRERGHRCHKYCALGVLCKVYVNDKKIRKWEDAGVGFMTPSQRVLDWAGMNLDEVNDIMGMNDTKDLSFKKIAKELRNE